MKTNEIFNNAVIGLGSNIAPQNNIVKARKLLAQNFQIVKESEFITTKPVGLLEQPDFINGSVLIVTRLDQHQLATQLKELETQLGREPSPIKHGPRIIDLDIVVWNNSIVDPDFYTRDFLRNSVLELIPELVY